MGKDKGKGNPRSRWKISAERADMAGVFISHSSHDKDFARRLAEDIRSLGHQPWLDEWQIKVGECIPTRIEEGLSQSDFVVVVLSAHAANSTWVEREWKSMYWEEIGRGSVRILPVLLEDCEVPLLLRTKLYADFRRNYPIGLVRLAAALNPSLPAEEVSQDHGFGPQNYELEDLIRRTQSNSHLLSETMAIVLGFARRNGHQALADFCASELAGYSEPQMESSPFRIVEAFVSLRQINMQFIGWGGRAANAWEHMSTDREGFVPQKLAISYPIAELENHVSKSQPNTLLIINRRYGDYKPDAPDPDTPVYLYARGDAMVNVLIGIRSELTRRLVALLPGRTVA